MARVFWLHITCQVVDSITTWAAEATQVADPKSQRGMRGMRGMAAWPGWRIGRSWICASERPNEDVDFFF